MLPPPADCVDWSVALATVGGHRDILWEMIEASREEFLRLLRELHSAQDRGVAKSVEYFAHTLKGGLASLGAARAANVAQQLETLGHQQTLANASAVLASLEEETTAVLTAFDVYMQESKR